MDISVVIPNHNRIDALDKTLEHLSKQKFGGEWETIVCDNNSTEDVAEAIQRRQPKFPVSLRLTHETIPGASAARNAGANRARGEYIIFLDNDILTEPNFLQSHFDALRKYPNSWINGQVVNLPEQENSEFGKFRKQSFPFIDPAAEIREQIGVTGQNLSLPRKDFNALDGFDNDLFSGEDFDLALRGRRQLGIRTLLVPNIVVVQNDWAGWTFPDFCQRQEIYARTEFFSWEKYGDEHPRLQLVKENLPLDWRQDSFNLLYRKKVKRILSRQISQRVLLRTSGLLEKIPALRPILWRVYKLSLAGAIHRGFHEGRKSVLERRMILPDSLVDRTNS